MPPRGQTWTTLEALSQSHMNSFHEYDTGLIGIGSQPAFAIGQRALLVRTEGGNILWDCVATLDAATVSMIKGLGGLKAIAISHPHFYTTMVEWARAFDCPIHLNAADSDWIMRKDPAIKLWDGDTFKLWDGVTLVRCGGHFPGRHGDALGRRRGRARHRLRGRYSHRRHRPQVAILHAQLSEFHSVVGARGRAHRQSAWRRFDFDMVYGHYFDRVIPKDAKQVLRKIRRALRRGDQRDARILKLQVAKINRPREYRVGIGPRAAG